MIFSHVAHCFDYCFISLLVREQSQNFLNSPNNIYCYIYIYIYIYYQSKVFSDHQKVIFLILKVLSLMKKVKHQNEFIYHTKSKFY